jgi:3-phenylpropionate/trans-cinnamate dioxygenase ferredoxin subunit
MHGARFALRTGEALSPPAYEPIATYPVRVAAGRVQVRARARTVPEEDP